MPHEPADNAAGAGAAAAIGPRPLRLGLWQPEARNEPPRARLDRLEAAIAAVAGGVDLVVTPELFLSGYNRGDAVAAAAEKPYGPSARAAAALARRQATALVIGYPEAAEDGLYNSALCLGPAGEALGNYRKRRLATDWERATFGRGDGPALLEIAGWRVGVLICWDVEVPEEVRALARAGAALIVVPTALRRRWAVVARAVVPARAFENGIFVGYANHAGAEGDWRYLGESLIAGPAGKDLARAGAGEEMLLATLDPAAPRRARRALCQITELDRYQGAGARGAAMLGRAPAGDR